MMAVLDPLIDIAVHVIEPECIGLFFADRMGTPGGPGIFAER
jgi:hypothetical protein